MHQFMHRPQEMAEHSTSAKATRTPPPATSVAASARPAPLRLDEDSTTSSPALPAVTFSTLVGPLAALQAVVDSWDRLVDAASLRVAVPPRILSLPPEAQRYAEQILRVAVVRHPPTVGARLVAALPAAITSAGIVGITVEEGYYLRPSAPPGATDPPPRRTSARWSVRWEDDVGAEALCPSLAGIPRLALGVRFMREWPIPPRVVVIDTGDEGSQHQVFFDSWDAADEQPCDHHGHGTSVGALLRLAAPHAIVSSSRVMGAGEKVVESSYLLNAVTVAVGAIGVYDVVCVPQRADISPHKLGQQMALHRMIRQNANNGMRTPVVVCAAGNDGPKRPMSYPATVAGVIVATAVDRTGARASYNCHPPLGRVVHCVEALGGTSYAPLGTLSGPGTRSRIFGSSYATAIVAGALLAARG